MSLTMDATAMALFDRFCRAVAARGKGLSLGQIGDAGALSRELSSPDPDPEKVELLRSRLGLESERVHEREIAR